MIFTTWPFVVFMTVVFVCYWWVVPSRGRRPFLLLASLAYFTYNYPAHTLLLGALTVSVYAIGNLIFVLKAKEETAAKAKAALIAGLVLAAGTLAFFKYSKMIVGVVDGIANQFDFGKAVLPYPNFLIPLGISFFTFEFIHYLTDLYHGKGGIL